MDAATARLEPIPEPHDAGTADLSVVITTKDRPDMFRRAAESAASVPGLIVDVIAVDDGSADPLVAPGHPDVRVLRHDVAQGANIARNAGLAVARGTWVMFLDDDDELDGDGVAAEVALLEHHGASAAALGTLVTIDENSGERERHVPNPLPRGTDWLAADRWTGRHAHNGLVVSGQVLRKVGGFHPGIRSWTHDELFLRLLMEVDLLTVPETVYYMYENSQRSTVRQQHLRRAQGIRDTLERHDEIHGATPIVTSNLMSAVGLHYARARQWRPAREAFAAALRADPTGRLVWVRMARALSGDRAA